MKNVDWKKIEQDIVNNGYAVIPSLISRTEASETAALYEDDSNFYYYKDMREWGLKAEYSHFGKGDVNDPDSLKLPALVQHFRKALYEGLHSLASKWMFLRNRKVGESGYFLPKKFEEFQKLSKKHGLTHPFTGIVAYEEGSGNAIHQDQEGKEIIFPFQMAVLLNDEKEFSGGRFILQQEGEKPSYIELKQGDAVVFPSMYRIIEKNKDDYDVHVVKHGVEPIKSNTSKRFCRMTLGIGSHNRPKPS